MRRTSATILWALFLAAGLAAAQAPTTGPAAPKMGETLSLPTAGAEDRPCPSGSRALPLGEPEEILAAIRVEGRQATQSLMLAIHAVEPDESAESFEARLVDESRQDLAVRHFSTEAQKPCLAGGLTGVQQSMQYTHRGTATSAIRACLVRDLPVAEGQPARRTDDRPVR